MPFQIQERHLLMRKNLIGVALIGALTLSLNLGTALGASKNSERSPSNSGVACEKSSSTKASSGNSRAQTCVITILLNPNGGTVSTASFLFQPGGEPIVLPIPTRSNYDFTGWFTAASGGSAIISPYTPTASITLFAQWSETALKIGDTGPGGGIIYYVSPSTFGAPGAACSPTCRYLEVAPSGWSGTQTDPQLPFALPSYVESYVAATGTDFGSGYANTEAIVNQNGVCAAVAECSYAAGAASAYRGGLKSDWYLPSRDELSSLASVNFYLVSLRPTLGLETPGNGYWNSWAGNPDAPGAATDTVFTLPPGGNNGFSGGYKDKSSPYYVRPIRAFK